jgi:hypothetical protein
MGFLTWAQVASLIQSTQTLGISYGRSEVERHSRDSVEDFVEFLRQLRDVSEGTELARNYGADDTARELAEYGTALMAVRIAVSSGTHGGEEAAQKFLRDLANVSDESAVRRTIDEIAAIARSDGGTRGEAAAELVGYGRSIL